MIVWKLVTNVPRGDSTVSIECTARLSGEATLLVPAGASQSHLAVFSRDK